MLKKILLIVIVIVSLLGIYTLIKKPIEHYLIVKQIEKDVLNFLNKKDNKHISEEGKTIYNYITNISNTEYSVSSLVERYINIVIGTLKSKYLEISIGDVDIKPLPFDERHNIYVNRVNYSDDLGAKEYFDIKNLLSENDLALYNQDVFETVLINKLENVLVHKGNDVNKDWYMNISNGKIVELPYNCYLEYYEGIRIDYNKTEQIYLNSEFIKCELEKSDNNFDFNGKGLTAKVIYKDSNGEIGNIWLVVGFENAGTYIKLTPHLKAVLHEIQEEGKTGEPYICLKSHDKDEYSAFEISQFNWSMIKKNDLQRIDIKIDEYINMLYDEKKKSVKEINDIEQRIIELYKKVDEEGVNKVDIDRIIFKELGIEVTFDDVMYKAWSNISSGFEVSSSKDVEKMIETSSEPYDSMYFKFREIFEDIKMLRKQGLNRNEIMEKVYDEIDQKFNMKLPRMTREEDRY